MKTLADRVVTILQTLSYRVESGREPRWSENSIRLAVDLAMKETEKHG